MNVDADFTPLIKIYSKWITNLNVKPNTIKLIEDNTGENLDDVGFGNDFVGVTSKIQSVKERIDKLDFIKIKNFCSVEDKVKRMKRQVTDLEKTFVIDTDTPDRVLLSKIYKTS